MKGLTVTIKQVCDKRGGPDAEWSSAEQVLDYDCMFNTTISVTPGHPQRRDNFCSDRLGNPYRRPQRYIRALAS
jgi:hypothetical protein